MQAGPSRWTRRATATSPPRINELLAELRAHAREHRGTAGRAGAEPRRTFRRQEVRKLRIELDVIGDAIKQTRSEIVSLQDQGFDSDRASRG